MAVKIFKNGKLVQVAGNYSPSEKKAFLMAHPVGSYYISDDATDPAALYGGSWDIIAENATIPLGSSASIVVNPNGNTPRFLKADGSAPFYNGNTTLMGYNSGNVHQTLGVKLDANNGYNYPAIIDPLGTLVASANTYIEGLYIWKRYA